MKDEPELGLAGYKCLYITRWLRSGADVADQGLKSYIPEQASKQNSISHPRAQAQ